MTMLKDRNTPEDVARIENLEELVRAVAESMEAGESFTDFLDAAALVSDADSYEGKPGVTLITLHSTKGLEFDHVFLTGTGRRDLPAQPKRERRERHRGGTAAGVRGNDAREKHVDADQGGVPARVWKRAANARFPALAIPERDSQRTGGDGARFDGGHGRNAALRAGSRSIRIRRTNFCAECAGEDAGGANRPRGERRRRAPSFGRPASNGARKRIRYWERKCAHPEYGVGTVVGVEGDEEDRRLSVSFPGRGTKKFVERYANLQQL